MSEKELLEKLANAVIDGDEKVAKKVAKKVNAANVDPVKAIQEGLAKGMSVVGEKFSKFEIFLPNVMLAADAMKAGLSILEPMIEEERKSEVTVGKVVIGTVFGDIHDIGKTLVATMLSVAGFEVHDLGCDVPSMKFIETAEEIEADIIAMSSLVTPSMFYQKDVINYLKDMQKRDRYYVIVGGGPITPAWAEEIVADGYGKYASDAVTIAKRLILEKPSGPLKEPIIKD
jgi:corrinoid protein of di/trimethylamine methyltransferase